MQSPDEMVKAAWQRAGGICECGRATHDHQGTCGKTLTWSNRGRNWGTETWEAYHRSTDAADGPDTLSNYEILCWTCYTKTMNAPDT